MNSIISLFADIYLRVKASFMVVGGSPGSLYPKISSTTTGLPGRAGDSLRSSCPQSKDRYATEPNKCGIRAHEYSSVRIGTVRCVTVQYRYLYYVTIGYGVLRYVSLLHLALGSSNII
jgi:hypothetical protein